MSTKSQIGRVAGFRHRERSQYWHHVCIDCGDDLYESDTDRNLEFLKAHRDHVVLQGRYGNDGQQLDPDWTPLRERVAHVLEEMGEEAERLVEFRGFLWSFALPERRVLIHVGEKNGMMATARHWIEQNMDWAVLRLPDHEAESAKWTKRRVHRAITRANRKARAAA